VAKEAAILIIETLKNKHTRDGNRLYDIIQDVLFGICELDSH